MSKSARPRLSVEHLEQRVLLTVEPITLLDPSRVGLSGLGTSQSVSMSDDGQVIAFQSDAPDLVANDTNGLADVFVYFRGSGRVELASIDSTGTGGGNALAKNPRVSPDGRYVLFESSANNLVSGISGPQLYARDLQAGQTILVSKSTAGVAGNALSQGAWWSGDSTRVVFESNATNLSPLDTNGKQDVFLRDLSNNTTTLLSINRDGTASGNAQSESPQISRDGKFVAFVSFATDLITNDVTNIEDVYVRDLTAGTTELVTIDTGGVNQPTSHPGLTENAISPDGRYVLFVTAANNLAPVPVGNGNNLYLRDRQLGTTTLVSINAANNAGVGGFSGSITADGRYITFVSNGTGLDAAVTDTNNTFDVFRRDLSTGVTRMVTTAGTNGGNGQSFSPQVSADGRYIAFVSEAGNLSADADGNQGQTTAANRRDIFVRDMQTGVTTNLSSGGNHLSELFGVSADFMTFAFETLADNLVAGDRNTRRDVAVRGLNLGVTELASRRESSLPDRLLGGGGLYSATPDGRYVTFTAGPSSDYAPEITFGVQSSSAYVMDRQTGKITVVDVAPNPTLAVGGFSPVITPNGRFVAFLSTASSLVNGITFRSGVDVYVRDLEVGVTRIVSVDPTGTQTNNGNSTSQHAISDDGRYVAFISNGTNLVAGISNPTLFGAVYLRDLWTGQTVLVSRNLANNGVITGASSDLSMTPDGRFITFTSRATDLTANDTNNQSDVFQWDRQTGNITLVSFNQAGTGPGGNNSGGILGFRPVMSASGRYVAFGSRANDLVAGDTNGLDDVYVRDMQLGTTTLVSVNTGGVNGGNFSSRYPSISPDGRKVLFLSPATNLTTVPVPVISDQVYYRDLDTGTTHLVTRNAAGTAASNNLAVVTSSAIDNPTFSPDGRYVAYRSMATDLVSGFVDANGVKPNVYLHDRTDGTTRLVEYNQSGTGPTSGNEAGFRFLFTYNNGTAELVFDTNAPDLIPGDRTGGADVFVFPIVGHGQIHGTVFTDTDKDGLRDGGETGRSGIAIFLDENTNGRPDANEPRLLTDSTGAYAFTNLAAGSYRIGVLWPGGIEATSAEQRTVTLPGPTALFANQDFGAVPAVADLAVSSIQAPSHIDAGEAFTVTWVTANRGMQAITGDWQEAVYLSADNVLDGADQLLGTVAHTGGLGSSTSIALALTVPSPATQEGTYHVFVEVDRRRQITADTSRTNNVGSTLDPLSISIPELTLGTAVNGTFGNTSRDRYYRLTVEAGQAVQLTLDSSATTGQTALHYAFGELPLGPFIYTQVFTNEPDSVATIPLTQAGTYYVLAHGRSGGGATAPFTLTAALRSFAIDSVGPNHGPANGQVTVEIRGSKLGFGTAPTLVQGGTVIAASMVDFRDPSLIYATFDLAGRPIGTYDVRVADGPQADTLTGGFTVEPPQPQPGALQVYLINPEVIRAGRNGRVFVEYVNTSNVDIPAPLLRLTATNATLRLTDQPDFESGDLTFYGHAPDGPAGVLRPGQRGRVEIEFHSTAAAGVPIDFQTFLVDPNEVLDWAAIKAEFRPGHIPVDAWDAVFANFLAEAGTTVGQYEAMLGRLANYLSSVGIYTADTIRLLNLALDLADGAHTAGSLASVIDSSLPASGFALSFSRYHQQPIHGRYTVGPFGRGWALDWDGMATTLPEGDVVIRFGSSRRFFFRLADGSYRGTPGDTGTLTLSGGVYTVTERDGGLARFHVDGKFDFVADPNGNRITAGYDGAGRLTSLTHTSGVSISLTYNASGFIDRLTDSSGRMVIYSYTGDHLTGYTDQYGSHTYTYVTGQGLAREHALASVNFSDDTHVNFTYDARGRLISEERDGGVHRLDYTYIPGGYTVSDAIGATATALFDDHGQLVRRIDALGRVTDLTYDADFNLAQVESPGGTISRYTYDAFGNLLTSIDPMGQQTHFTYDGRDNLTSFTDALGRRTSYRYDAANNMLGIDYPNGTGERYTYDVSGDLSSSTNRRGNVIGYQTNPAGQITRKTYADGSFITYTYDTRGRLETATDSTGTITLEYDGRDVLKKVTYPNGRFLRFEYNIVGQRTKSVDQDGFTVNYAYDDPGRLDRVTDGVGALIVDYTYDDASRLIREDKGNGTATTYEYNLAGEVLTITHLAPGEVLNSRYEYTYDALGRRATMTLTDNDPNTPDGTTSYGYDPLGQLISVAVPGGRTITYTYDAVGNRVSVNDGGVITAYTTNVANEYTQVGDTFYTYDLDGNLYSKTDASGTMVYSFNEDNRLVGVNGSELTANYTYDALGHRNSSTINGATTTYLIDPVGLWSVTGEYDGSGVALARYTYGFGLVSQVGAAGTSYYDFDATGNTVGLTDAAGQYMNRYSYLPFGETTTHSAGVANPFTFVGQFGVQAEPNGWFGMRFRSFDPLVGRFVSNDPLRLAAGDVNFRRYVGNDPVSAMDPFGLIRWYNYQPLKPSRLPPTFPGGSANCSPTETLKDPFSNNENDDPSTDWSIYFDTGGNWWTQDSNGTWYSLHTGNIAPYGDPGNASTGGGAGGGAAGGSGANGGGGDAGGGCSKCDCPPGRDPGGPSRPGPGGSTGTATSFDPNDITGPAGVGDPRFVAPDQALPYTIRFENLESAKANAQEVFVTHTLDADVDLATFELGDFGFGDVVLDVPNGLQTFTTRIAYQNPDLSPLTVEVTASLDLDTRIVTWTFRSLDPATGLLPDGVLEGFLPPNDDAGKGQGFVTYVVRPNPGLATGTTIDAQASIVFDTNPAIVTNTFTNTLDASPPATAVTAPAVSSSASFPVGWSGTDPAGVASYDVYVSVDGNPYSLWLPATTATLATYNGSIGHTYRFAAVGTDHLGNSGAAPVAPQATVQTVAASNWVLRRSGSSLQLLDASRRLVFTRPLSDPTPLSILGGAGPESLTIDLAVGGPFAVPGGIQFDGGPGGGDRFLLVGTAGTAATLTPGASQTFAVAGGTITVSGVESHQVSGVGALNVVTTGGNDTFTVVRPAPGRNRVQGTGLPALTFFGVRDLTLDVGVGDSPDNSNTVVVNGPWSATGLRNVTVVGGAGTDVLSLLGTNLARPVAGGLSRFLAGAGADTVIATGNTSWALTRTALVSGGGGFVAFSGVERGQLTGGAGNNVLNARSFSGTALLFGGAGNDRLLAGAAGSILLGGTGNDVLAGGGSRDLLIGGTGADTLLGGGNDDLLIGGRTAHDVNAAALLALLAEWRRLDLPYAQRVANLRNGTGLNGSARLSNATVLDDVFRDTLTGNAGFDWFWPKVPPGVADAMMDRRAGEAVR